MKQRLTKNVQRNAYNVIIEIPGEGKHYASLPSKHLSKLETFLQKYAEFQSWEEVAAPRIAKYGKVGLALRGARYREGISQKELAERTGIKQENISKMENGLRPVGPKVRTKLAAALHISEDLLLF